jgi:hypothetical protein
MRIIQSLTDFFHESEIDRHPDFSSFQLKYGKAYSSEEEQAYREFIYYRQIEKIAKHNSNPDSKYQMGVNQFTDLSHKEFAEMYLTFKAIGTEKGFLRKVRAEDVEEEYQPEQAIDDPDLKQDVNWTHLFPPVKDQYGCSSCYSFPVTAAVEALYAKKDGKIRSFS